MLSCKKVIDCLKIIRTWAVCDVITSGDNQMIADTIDDTLSLLNAQQPRVLTLEEACAAELVWYEQVNLGLQPVKVIQVPYKPGVYRIQRFGNIDTWEHVNEYREMWRCWNIKPSDEQRSAIPWQD